MSNGAGSPILRIEVLATSLKDKSPHDELYRHFPTAPAHDRRHVFKLADAAQKSWRRLDGDNQLPKVVLGAKFQDGLEVVATTDHQPKAAA